MGIADTVSELMGVTEKAVLEIADFSGKVPKYADAAKVSAGAGSNMGTGDFNEANVKQAMAGAGIQAADTGGFVDLGEVHRYRYKVTFNPEEISIVGYGGEEMPVQDFASAPERPPGNPGEGEGGGGNGHHHGHHHGGPPRPSSRMASPNTRIDFSVRLVLDQTSNIDCFYGDKFTLSQTQIAKNVTKSIMGSSENNVQKDVEALTAIARDRKKRLARFVWGDMIYEGLINSINAEYVMFNIYGEPCRAYVTLNMVLFDNEELPSSKTMWQNRYIDCFNPKAKHVDGIADNL